MMLERIHSDLELSESKLFDWAVREIKGAYPQLGCGLGWRFLYSPKGTLSSKSRLMFMGLNPGGSADDFPGPEIPEGPASIEKGNAYRPEIEQWPSKKGGGGAALQGQVCGLFQRIAADLGTGQSWEVLMDLTLTANYYPFRSSRWTDLMKSTKKDLTDFAQALWSEICQHLVPAVLICNGIPAFREFQRVFSGLGYKVVQHDQRSIGWGDITCKLADLHRQSDQLLMVGLPHLSTFKILSREECEEPLTFVLQAVAHRLEA